MSGVLHDAALETTLAVVDAVPDHAWDDPTPCDPWTVTDLVGHLAWGNTVLAAAVRGGAYREPTGQRTLALPPPRPVAYRATVDDVRAALGAGVPDTVAFPTGTIAVTTALDIRVMDLVVHTWDLATATGTTPHLDDALVAAAGRTARERLAAGTLGRPHFAPPQTPTAGASALDRLLLTVGRRPRSPTVGPSGPGRGGAHR